MTKERLYKYRGLCKELQQIERKIETMEAGLFSPKIQRLTGMPSAPAGGGNAKEDLMAEHIELLRYYKEKAAELKAEQLSIERAIDALEHIERTIVRLYYIDGLRWEQVCARVNYSRRQVHNIVTAAMDKLGAKKEPEA